MKKIVYRPLINSVEFKIFVKKPIKRNVFSQIFRQMTLLINNKKYFHAVAYAGEGGWGRVQTPEPENIVVEK